MDGLWNQPNLWITCTGSRVQGMLWSMKRASQLPPELQHRGFSTREGLDFGLSATRMRGADLGHPFPGTRVQRGAPDNVESRIETYSKRMPTTHYFSHVTAAIIHGLPMPWGRQHSWDVHVCSDVAATRPDVRGVIAHHAEPGSLRIQEVRGLHVTCPVDTWCQLSSMLGLDDLIRLGDALVRRQHPLAEMRDLLAAVRRYSGHRGVKRLHEALIWIRPGVDSPRETDLRLLIVRAGLPEPEVNAIIMSRTGVKLATGDLVFRRYRVLLEYDGGQHRTDENQYHWDVDRLDALMENTWRVIRINKSHLRNPSEVIRRVTAALITGGWHP
ncbi:DUF559 domain-containing protein [Cryobacterium aureum]|uniref:DUF559 domain-containing protein n=1 Tax=Cryobacterium aureum TaxID=995037 RepID=UPI000CF4A85F|nr:DUF559 domain-containing protein [Cryobacterium aureum]